MSPPHSRSVSHQSLLDNGTLKHVYIARLDCAAAVYCQDASALRPSVKGHNCCHHATDPATSNM